MSCVLLVDVGGTFIKFSVDETSNSNPPVVHRLSLPEPSVDSIGGRIVSVNALTNAIGSVIDSVSSGSSKIDGVFVTGQMHGLVLVDESLSVHSEVYTWRSSAKTAAGAAAHLEVEMQMTDSQRFRTGNELRSGSPLATLYALRTHNRLLSELTAISLISFVALTIADRERNLVLHDSDAAAFGFFNLLQSEWDTELLETLDLLNLVLPPVSSVPKCVGVNRQLNCPVFTAVGDHQASLLGVGLMPTEVSVNLATGGQVSRIVKRPDVVAQCRPYFNNSYLSCVTHIPAGRSLNVLVRLLTETGAMGRDEAWDYVSRETRLSRNSDLLVRGSFFSGHFGETGSIERINEDNFSIGGLFRAALNNLSETVKDSICRLVSSGPDAYSLVFSGGLLRTFPFLAQEISDTTRFFRTQDSEDASIDGIRVISRISESN